MLDRKEVTCFISNKFVKVDQAVKEDADLLVVFLQLLEREVTLLSWLYHVIHLAEKVNEENRLMVEVLKSVHLLLIEVLHLMWSDGEPILETTGGGFVFLG